MKYIATENDAGARLDAFLAARDPAHSRSSIKRLIDIGLVRVNCVVAKAHRPLKIGDEIIMEPLEEKSIVKAGTSVCPDIPVVFACDDYLVVDKPAGIAVHASTTDKHPSLIDCVIKNFPEISRVGHDPDRPGIVHRLDKDVSGALVIARNERMFESLSRQFKIRKVVKRYQAIVYGSVRSDEGAIDFPLARSKRTGKTAARPRGGEGKNSFTSYSVKIRTGRYTLLDVCPKTGRTHQIRAHLSAIGHPIVGDDLYGTRISKINNKKLGTKRIFLHSCKLGFHSLAGTYVEYDAPLPDEISSVIE